MISYDKKQQPIGVVMAIYDLINDSTKNYSVLISIWQYLISEWNSYFNAYGPSQNLIWFIY